MGEREFREKLAKLQAMIAIKDAQVMANPFKYLNDMSSHCVRLLKVLEDVEYALSPDIIFDFAEEHKMRPADINGEAYIRCARALKVIKEYKDRGRTDGPQHAG